MNEDNGNRRAWWAAVLLIAAWPVVLLWPCLFGARTFVPYDLAQFPPVSVSLDQGQIDELRRSSNFDVTEVPVWFLPESQLARQSLLQEGSLPGWNPYARTGTALLAHGHTSLSHPPHWLALAFADPAQVLGWIALLALLTAGLLTLGFLRQLGLSLPASVLGAIAFTGSSTLLANAHNYPRLWSLVFLPGMLWALSRIAACTGRERWPSLCGFAVCFALTWTGGFPPYALPCTLVALAFGTALVVAHWRRQGIAQARGLAVAGTAALVLGVALAGVYLLPAMQFFPDSARTVDPGLAQISHNVFEHYGLLGYLLPDLFGRPDLVAASTLPYDRSPLTLLLGTRSEWGGQALPPNFNTVEYAVYPGTVVLLLAAAGLAARRVRHRWFPLVTLVVLLAMATFTLPFALLYTLPGIKTVPPLRFLGPASLMVAWLAAHGLDTLRERVRPGLWPVVAGLGLLLAGLCFVGAARFDVPGIFEQWGLPERAAARYAHLGEPGTVTPEFVRNVYLRSADGAVDYADQGRIRARQTCRDTRWFYLAAVMLIGGVGLGYRRRRLGSLAVWGCAVLAGTQLLLAGRTFNRGVELRHPTWTPIHDFLLEQRDDRAERGGFTVARAATTPAVPLALPPGTLQPHRIRDLQVYTFFDKWTKDPLRALFGTEAVGRGYVEQSLPDDPRLQHPLLDLLGVRYVLADQPLQFAGTRVGPEYRGPGGEFFIYQRATALPRAFVVPELRVLPDDAAVVAAVVDLTFRPADYAVISAECAAAAGLAATIGDAGARQRAVRFATDRMNEVVLDVGPGPAGFLVLADTWLPGWRAHLVVSNMETTELDVARADGGLRLLPAAAGAFRVRFRYRTPGLAPGLALSLSGIAAAVLLLLLGRRRAAPA